MTSVSFRGDLTKLRGLVGKLNVIRQRSTMSRMNKLMSADALGMTLDCFKDSRDPYGEKWKPIKHREGLPLVDTGRLRNSIQATSGEKGFKLATNVVYAAIHNYGGTIHKKTRIDTQFRGRNGKRVALAKLEKKFAKLQFDVQAGNIGGRKFLAARKRLKAMKKSRVVMGAHDITMPRRQFMPDVKKRGLPKAWRESFHEVITDYVERLMR